ncbi:MAG: lipopolysaccharide heptosyltransferase family protein, partial [Candidatus Zixiibacteriota bacterium]
LRRILFIRPEKIGDMVVSFPVFDALRQAYPHLKLYLLASPTCYPVVQHDPRFEKIYVYRKPIGEAWRVIKEVRKEQFDYVVDLICDDSVTALFLSQLCAPGSPRIGVGKMKYAPYYDFNYDHRQGNTGHIIDNTLKLLAAFDLDPDKASGYAPPHLEEADIERADTFIQGIVGEDKRLIGYNLSAGKSCRWWPADKARALIEKVLAADDAYRVLLFSTPAERSQIRKLAAHFDGRVVMIPDGLTIIGASALLRRLDLLITPDTSLVHIARSFHVPVVGLYPNFMRNYLLWRPYDQERGAVVSPTTEIRDISVEQVYETFCELAREHLSVGS